MNNYSTHLKYGKEVLLLVMPSDNLLDVIQPKEIHVPKHPVKLIESALDASTHGPPFDSLFKRGDKTTIVVSDITVKESLRMR